MEGSLLVLKRRAETSTDHRNRQIEELKASRLDCVVACGTLSFPCVCDSKPVLEASCISFLHRNWFSV